MFLTDKIARKAFCVGGLFYPIKFRVIGYIPGLHSRTTVQNLSLRNLYVPIYILLPWIRFIHLPYVAYGMPGRVIWYPVRPFCINRVYLFFQTYNWKHDLSFYLSDGLWSCWWWCYSSWANESNIELYFSRYEGGVELLFPTFIFR